MIEFRRPVLEDRDWEDSLILLDESFSSTGAYEASYIAAEVLRAISYMGCRCIFSTHLHQLVSEIEVINEEAERNGYAKIDTLVAGIETGKRSFKITRQKPDGKSYARDIALKYGISYDSIINNFKTKHVIKTINLTIKNDLDPMTFKDNFKTILENW